MSFLELFTKADWRAQLRWSATAAIAISLLPPFLVLLLGAALYSFGIYPFIWLSPPLVSLLIANRAKSRSLLVVLLLGVNILMISGTLVYDFVAVKESLDRDRRMQAYYQGVRETVFREVVLEPIPKSVKNLEMKGSQYSTFRLTFDVSREDFQKILSARPYEKESEENPFFKGMLNYKYLENTGRRIRYGIMVNADASHVVFDRVME